MIIGIGHDIASLDRMERMLAGEAGLKFQRRILTERELQLSAASNGKRLAEFTAGRFAVKEAVSKAFGCGIGSKLSFRDIEVDRHESGKPVCRLTDDAWERLGYAAEKTAIHITITHDQSLASAFAVVERLS
ncbi:holo-ACP synthase [Paenibacillus montanisoli]|uniref:Holo-[acyl-carrier-protein] synthase n=1 Tax=Paenibacillus montanisoli TaxID=2081970 RepID=A0A328U1B4_9BACL|nr:holo-ACP synthase [Paenibacillus montanisoli]RAP75241.1 holo-[acyl-carrier-protein] synthase [Paenibacillus montanisoli]